jgi:hypothetical protein
MLRTFFTRPRAVSVYRLVFEVASFHGFRVSFHAAVKVMEITGIEPAFSACGSPRPQPVNGGLYQNRTGLFSQDIPRWCPQQGLNLRYSRFKQLDSTIGLYGLNFLTNEFLVILAANLLAASLDILGAHPVAHVRVTTLAARTAFDFFDFGITHKLHLCLFACAACPLFYPSYAWWSWTFYFACCGHAHPREWRLCGGNFSYKMVRLVRFELTNGLATFRLGKAAE